MCGIVGVLDLENADRVTQTMLGDMSEAIHHRGPDESSVIIEENFGVGFKRLSIIDIQHGQQPFYNEDRSVVMYCNGEIFNHKELRQQLSQKGHKFRSSCDVEVIVPMYLEYGADCFSHLKGQFGIVIYDKRERVMLLARDQFGICPMFYTMVDGQVIFGSEVKSIIRHPQVKKEPNLTAVDQVFSFPGIVSPSSFFQGVSSVKPGHFIRVKNKELKSIEYWDLEYPKENDFPETKADQYYIERLDELLKQSVKYRLGADVPVGFYLSGGLDSSLIGALIREVSPQTEYKSFSIGFPNEEDREHDERKYQRLMAQKVHSDHHEIEFDWKNVTERLRDAVYFSEGALKESYNACSLALSESVKNQNVKVILSGEGSDEIFGGYVGYRFDIQRLAMEKEVTLEDMLEDQMRSKLWGDPNFFYELDYSGWIDTKRAVYSDQVNTSFDQFDAYKHLEIDKSKLEGIHPFHKRSYLDLKLRLSDHLVSDHCDRVNYANSVEGRFPFLDVDLVEFVKTIPPEVKLRDLVEKYILKEVASNYLPAEIYRRQKTGFVAPGSPQLIRNDSEWIGDMLSYDRIKRQGYFNPETTERIKKMYSQDGFRLNLPFDPDLLIVILTFNIFLDVYDMPSL